MSSTLADTRAEASKAEAEAKAAQREAEAEERRLAWRARKAGEVAAEGAAAVAAKAEAEAKAKAAEAEVKAEPAAAQVETEAAEAEAETEVVEAEAETEAEAAADEGTRVSKRKRADDGDKDEGTVRRVGRRIVLIALSTAALAAQGSVVKQLSYIGSGWEEEGAPLMLSAPPLTPMEYDSSSTWSAMGTALFGMGTAWLSRTMR